MAQTKERIPKAVLAEMWQFFLQTSVPVIMAEHEECKRKGLKECPHKKI